jgi:hypothetical protein
LIAEARRAIREGKMPAAGNLSSELDRVEALLKSVPADSVDAANRAVLELGVPESQKVNGALFKTMEADIARSDGALHVDPRFEGALPRPIQQFLETSTALSPHVASRYWTSRFHLSDADLAARYRLLNIDPTPENMARMKWIDAHLETASPQELQAVQDAILNDPKRPFKPPAIVTLDAERSRSRNPAGPAGTPGICDDPEAMAHAIEHELPPPPAH